MDRRAVLRAVLLGPLAVTACSAPPAGAPAAAPPPSAPDVRSAAPAAAPASARPTGELVHAGTGRPEVALTFHGAGDEALARRLLTLLHDRGAAGTVLAVGTWLQRYPDAGRMVVDLGHELGNHTWSHPDLAALDEAGVRVEIERCRDLIAGGHRWPRSLLPALAGAARDAARPAGSRGGGLSGGAVLRRRLAGLHRPRCRGGPAQRGGRDRRGSGEPAPRASRRRWTPCPGSSTTSPRAGCDPSPPRRCSRERTGRVGRSTVGGIVAADRRWCCWRRALRPPRARGAGRAGDAGDRGAHPCASD